MSSHVHTPPSHPSLKRHLILCPLPSAGSTCECLRGVRNYGQKGKRLNEQGNPTAPGPAIFECNLNCRCHVDHCRNRLVQKGITCSLAVSLLVYCMTKLTTKQNRRYSSRVGLCYGIVGCIVLLFLVVCSV